MTHLFTKNESKYYYDSQYKIRLITQLNNIECQLNEINSLFKLFRKNESKEKITELNKKRNCINNKYNDIINILKHDIVKCNRRIEYNKSRF